MPELPDIVVYLEALTPRIVLADRALSRLLKDDWPRSLEEWEARLGSGPYLEAP